MRVSKHNGADRRVCGRARSCAVRFAREVSAVRPRFGSWALSCWLANCSWGLAADAPVAPADIIVLHNLRYREGPNKAWTLDLAMKKGRGGNPRPGIVVIHGGGWVGGDKADCATRRFGPCNILDFAALGFVAVGVNYRLAAEAPFPAALEDCQCAVRWLRAHAKDYHLDPKSIGAVGPSAGAHLALLLGLAGKSAGREGDGPHQEQSSLVQAAAGDSGFVDLHDAQQLAAYQKVIGSFLGGPPEGPRAERYRQASPIHRIHADAPPLLLIYGVRDNAVPVETADRFVAALHRAGRKDVTYFRLAHAGHCPYANREVPYLQTAVNDFFIRTLMDPETAKGIQRRAPAPGWPRAASRPTRP